MCNPPPLLSLCNTLCITLCNTLCNTLCITLYNTLCITLCNTSPPPSLPQALMAVLASHRVIQSSAAVRGRLPTLLLPLAIHLHLLPTYSQGETLRHRHIEILSTSFLFIHRGKHKDTKTQTYRNSIHLLPTYSQGETQRQKDTDT